MTSRNPGQGFIGVKSWYTGKTVIMLPVWEPLPDGRSALRIRLKAGMDVEPDVLGYADYIREGRVKVTVVLPNGISTASLGNAISVTDAAYDILHYLNELKDPRLRMHWYAWETEWAR
jgi:hypothetical protein